LSSSDAPDLVSPRSNVAAAERNMRGVLSVPPSDERRAEIKRRPEGPRSPKENRFSMPVTVFEKQRSKRV